MMQNTMRFYINYFCLFSSYFTIRQRRVIFKHPPTLVKTPEAALPQMFEKLFKFISCLAKFSNLV
jgi:hypothetical protein